MSSAVEAGKPLARLDHNVEEHNLGQSQRNPWRKWFRNRGRHSQVETSVHMPAHAAFRSDPNPPDPKASLQAFRSSISEPEAFADSTFT